jgi:hypothetical protein
MKLFTITASIISLVAGVVGHAILEGDREGHAYWCGEIAAQEWVQRQIFDDRDAAPLPECDTPQRRAEAYDKGGGTGIELAAERLRNRLARSFGQSEKASFDRPKSLASIP